MAQETTRISREIRERINDAIRANPETLAEYFLPPGLVFLGRRGRFSEWNKSKKQAGGGNDRFIIEHNGTAPRFANYRDDKHGRGVHYIERHCGVEWQEAYRIAAGIYGFDIAGFAPDPHAAARREAERKAAEAHRQREQEREDRLTAEKDAAAHAVASRLIATLPPADASHPYAVRKGITFRSGVLFSAERITARLWSSKDERFRDNALAVPSGALVIPLQDATGETVNLQTIPADPKARKLFLSGGQVAGLFHVIPGIEPGYLVEGFATGCTVAEATGRAVFVALSAGNLPSVARIAGPRVAAVAADHDQSGTGEAYARKTGLPWRIPPKEGNDWNDAAATYGLAGVAARLAGLIPEPPKPRPPVDDARRDLTARLSDWLAREDVTGFAEADEGQAPPALLLPVGTGIGKTVAALKAGLAWKAERPNAGPLVISVPMHSLAEDIAAKVASVSPGATVKIWQGRSRDGMCQNLDAVDDYIAAHASPGEYCRTHCPFKEGCAYLGQNAGDVPTVWIITHALLTETPPKGLGNPCLLIVDEQFWTNAVTGTDGAGWLSDGLRVSADFDRRYPGIGQGQEVADRMTRMICAIESASERGEGEPTAITAQDLGKYGFTPDTILGAIDQTSEVFNWLLGKKPDRVSVRKWRHDRAALARALGCLREIKRAFDEGAGSVWRLTVWRDRDGRTVARRTGTRSLHAGWAAPMLFLDATANPTALRAIIPQLEASPAIVADTPHARHHWRKTRGMGAKRQRDDTESKALDMARIAWMRWRLSGGASGLIVCHEVTHQHMNERGAGFLPPGWSVEHFRNTTGRDDWKNVGFVEIFGRVLPPIETPELYAVALTSTPVLSEGEGIQDAIAGTRTFRRLIPREVTRIMSDGRPVTVSRYSHPDPMANAVLQEMLDGELVQCAGRARAVNRGEAEPVTITLHGDTYPEGLPLDGIEDDTPSHPIDKMLAAGRGLLPVLLSPTDAARAYPELWTTSKAAERDFARAKGNDEHRPPKPLYRYIKEKGGLWSLAPSALLIAARYQKEGERQKRKAALVPPEMVSAFPGWIAARMGCAVRVEWVEAEPPPPESPPPDARPVVDLETVEAIPDTFPSEVAAVWMSLPPDRRALFDKAVAGLYASPLTEAMRSNLMQVICRACSDDDPRRADTAKACALLAGTFDGLACLGIPEDIVREVLAEIPAPIASDIMRLAPWLRAGQFGNGLQFLADTYRPKRGNLEAFL